ncbi:DMT family transporter [Leeia sp. TBRC 13508]|uniref:DMT family transporter n=1 Tax=Leeia speluncae TaxID=2884804 RepID=A0ABS8D7F1_9NEIS|nr:DMT family transporter [Leeia speluncae]MCB6184125.1 DMT family transporter [Leeia speluncae]
MGIVAALFAIILWGALAILGVSLSNVPPFLLTGASLLVGGVLTLPYFKQWKLPLKTFLLGIYGLFGFHFLLFMALRYAPPIEANLINYLWPLLIVLLTPVFLPGMKLRSVHWIAAIAGAIGAVLAISGGKAINWSGGGIGYLFAAMSATVWATYSLGIKRVSPFPTAAVGGICLLSAGLSLSCHLLFESTPNLSTQQWLLIGLLGIGPMGIAFYLWDWAMKHGDPRRIGVLANLTPVLSTILLHLYTGRTLTLYIAGAAILITGAAGMVWWSEQRRNRVNPS